MSEAFDVGLCVLACLTGNLIEKSYRTVLHFSRKYTVLVVLLENEESVVVLFVEKNL